MEYPESKLTHKIIGIAYEIFNTLGPGYPEKIYQKAFAEKFKQQNIEFKKELYCDLCMDDKKIGYFFLDFLVDKKVILEIKARGEIFKKDISQILTYLKINHIKVGLIILFSNDGVKLKRLVL